MAKVLKLYYLMEMLQLGIYRLICMHSFKCLQDSIKILRILHELNLAVLSVVISFTQYHDLSMVCFQFMKENITVPITSENIWKKEQMLIYYFSRLLLNADLLPITPLICMLSIRISAQDGDDWILMRKLQNQKLEEDPVMV